MPLLSASADTFFLGATICVILFARRSHSPAPTKNVRRPKYWELITAVLAVHTLYIMYILSFKTPPNLFTRLHLPLSTPSERIRAMILSRVRITGEGTLPEHIEELLMKLNTSDLRTYFVRFGQTAIQECEWCTTFTEYAAYTLPNIVLSYLEEAAFIGVVTIRGTNRETWRSTTIGLLTLACILDVYLILTVRIAVDQQDLTMWHDTLWMLRHFLFAVLPLITHFALPTSFTNSPLALAPQTNFALQALHRRIQLLKLTAVVTLRVPEFRQTVGSYWGTQRMEGRWAREDDAINRLSEKTGTGTKREAAREIAARLKRGFEL